MMNHKKSGKYRKAIFCVVYRKQGDKIIYLLLKRKLHWRGWEFPKGGSEAKEITNKTILREVKEETGQRAFNIKKYSVSGKFNYDKIYKDRPGIIGQTYKLFSAEIKNSKVKIDKLEHSSYKWIDFERSIKLLTHQNQKKCLKIVNKEMIK